MDLEEEVVVVVAMVEEGSKICSIMRVGML